MAAAWEDPRANPRAREVLEVAPADVLPPPAETAGRDELRARRARAWVAEKEAPVAAFASAGIVAGEGAAANLAAEVGGRSRGRGRGRRPFRRSRGRMEGWRIWGSASGTWGSARSVGGAGGGGGGGLDGPALDAKEVEEGKQEEEQDQVGWEGRMRSRQMRQEWPPERVERRKERTLERLPTAAEVRR